MFIYVSLDFFPSHVLGDNMLSDMLIICPLSPGSHSQQKNKNSCIIKILDLGHCLALSNYVQYSCLSDSRCYIYLGINIIIYILLILHEKHLLILYPRGLIISPRADGNLCIKIDNGPLCKIKDVGQLLLWQLSNLHNCICLSKFPLKHQLNKVFLCICILKDLIVLH